MVFVYVVGVVHVVIAVVVAVVVAVVFFCLR